MIEIPIWYEYAVYDDNGVCGIKSDAPEDAKKEYEKYLKDMDKAKKDGIRI